MTFTEPQREEPSLSKYWTEPAMLHERTGKPIDGISFIKTDPQSKDSWPQGARLIIPQETPPGSYVVAVSLDGKGKTITQAFEVVQIRDGVMGVKKTEYHPALDLAKSELDTFNLPPDKAQLKIAQMRKLQPGTSVTEENRMPSHVQLLPSPTVTPHTKQNLGLITPQDMARYRKTVEHNLQASMGAKPAAAATRASV